MKKLLLFAVAVAVALGVCYAGATAIDNHYQAHKNKQLAQQASAVEVAKKAQYDADQSRYSNLVKQYSDLQAQCEKGTAAYAKLTAVLKAQTPSPQCTAPAAQ